MRLRPSRDTLFLLMLTAGAVLLHGYHTGVQDQAIYLPAIKKLLNPALYPHDAEFFLSQTRWMLFDEVIAGAARVTGSLEWTLLAIQLLTVFLVLLGCQRLARCCFAEPAAQWAGVCTVAAMLTLPATGTLIPLVDNYLHPRGLATAAILLAWPAALAGRPWWLIGIAVAAPFHPMMALVGAFHLVVQSWKPPRGAVALGLLPLALMTAAPQAGGDGAAWRMVLESRRHLFPLQWAWYEWIGVAVPLLFLWWMWRSSRGAARTRACVASRLLASTTCGIVVAIAVSVTPGLERLVVAQPMRVLHVAYMVFFLLLGGWLSQAAFRRRGVLTAAFVVALGSVMFYVQLRTFEGSAHIEWPGAAPRNAWVQAFVWVKQNTAPGDRVALDPDYMSRPGEDYHGFRAFAERGTLADNVKDRAVAGLTPSLAATWQQQARLLHGWDTFQPHDFMRLRAEASITWVVIEQPVPAGMNCPYANDVVLVCKLD